MKLSNAIKKLSKYGEVKQTGLFYSVEIGNDIIQFIADASVDNPTISCINIRKKKDISDPMRDYNAGVFCDNLKQAIDFAMIRQSRGA